MKRFVSLKARILLSFGSLIVLLMLIISLSALYQWRKLIINDQITNTEAIAQSFSFSVLDALIYRENNLQNSEDYLQSYLLNYAAKNRSIKYVAVWDELGRLVAHSDIRALSRPDIYPAPVATENRQPVTQIFQHPALGWVIETDFPLQTGRKRLGMLQIAFDSEPTRLAIRDLFFLLLGLASVSVFILLWVLYYFANRLTASLTMLVNNMDAFDLQNEQNEPLPPVHDETGYLLRHFELLKNRLGASRQKLLSAQKQIHQAEKLASVGRLASGVAHEINNPLNGIKNCIYVLEKHADDPAQREKYLPLINEGLNQIETIVRKLLNFARQESAQFRQVQLNKEIELVLSLLEYRLNEKQIELHLSLLPDLPPIKADAQLIQEVLMNLLINALDAVAQGGHISIETRLPEAGRVLLVLSDNGCGIPTEALDHIFDPFFTTKEEGKGTGLGLSVSLGIIEAHNGTIGVSSTTGKTEFRILLPVQNV